MIKQYTDFSAEDDLEQQRARPLIINLVDMLHSFIV